MKLLRLGLRALLIKLKKMAITLILNSHGSLEQELKILPRQL